MKNEVLIDGYRLSPQQRRLWLMHDNHRLQHRAKCAIMLEGKLDKESLREALHHIVNQHEVLRTTFQLLPGMTVPLQVIVDADIVWSADRDLSSLDSRQQCEAIDELFMEADESSSDDWRIEPVRACLLSLSQDRNILLLSIPTLLLDSCGLKNLVKELGQSYVESFEPGPLRDDTIQYVIISEWLNELVDSEDAAAGRRFWKGLFNNLDRHEIFDAKLPLERRSDPSKQFLPQAVSLAINPDLIAKLRSLADQHDIAFSELCLASWQILLWRLTQSANGIVGVIFDGRTDEEIELSLGLLTRCLPVHCNFSESLTIDRVIQQTCQSLHDANSWQECFNWDDITGSGESSADYYFPFCFEFDDLSESYKADSVTFSLLKKCVYVDRSKIKLDCIQTKDSFVTEFHYNSELYSSCQIDLLARQFHALLDSISEDQSATIDQLNILSDRERNQVIIDFNHTEAHFQQGKCIHELFEDQVDAACDSVALALDGEFLTLAELNARANQLAHYLRSLGVGPEVMVALCMERSLEMIVGLLGILKSGGAYIPLDPEYPRERLAFILQDTQAPVLLTQKRLAENLPDHEARAVYLDGDWSSIARSSPNNLNRLTGENNLAYVIYTSGSTGIPKGVLIPHKDLVSHCFAVQKEYGLSASDKVLQFATSNFDVSLEQILPPLISRSVVVLRGNGMWDAHDLCRRILDYALSIVNLPTAYWNLFIEKCRSLQQSAEGCALRLMISGGETMFVDQQHRWLQTPFGAARLLNAYGPTETTITATTFDCAVMRNGRNYPVTVPIGYPLANRAIYLLDASGKPVPIGVPAELHIGGIGLARGYLNRPDLTAEKFIPSVFGGKDGARLYKTGDLARYWPDGEIEFLGRSDHQVKIRGFRIELGEIEAALRRHSEVREAAVVTREHETEGKQLIAYVASDNRPALDSAGLRSFLREKLPEYMIPAHFAILDSLPLTPSGKVDRQALPVLRQSDLEGRSPYVAPRTTLESALADVWAQVLNRQQVGVYDNFFDLGGHSLLGVQIITRLNERLDIGVKIRDLFFHPTIDQLARRIDEITASMEWRRGVALVARPEQQYYDLSHAQKRLWFVNQLIEGDISYIIPFGVYIKGKIDKEIFERVWQHMISRHQGLRTLFIAKDGIPKAVIESGVTPPLKYYDLADFETENSKRLIRAEVEEDQRRPFSLAEGPLFRVMLFRLQDGYFYLCLNMHHIITDGWSTGILFNDFLVTYESLINERPVPLEPLKFKHTDYVAWEEETERSDLWREQEERLIKEMEKPLPSLNLPLDFPRFEVQHYNGDEIFFENTPELQARLVEIARARNVSLFMLTLTAYFILLRHLTQQNDIIVGFPAAGRVLQGIENMVGFFVNTLVIRIKFDATGNVEELLNQVREKCLRAYENQAYPFDVLVKKVNPDRQLDRSAIISTMFALQNYVLLQKPLSVTGFERVEVDQIVEKTSKFDLSLTGVESNDRLRFSFTYNSDLFKEETIRTFSSQYLKVLQYLVEALC